MPSAKEKIHLGKLREGDLDSFRWVYDRYHEQVYGFCLKLSGVAQIAEEITQDVFVRLWEKRQIVDPELPIGGLLLKITKDFTRNYFKKTSRQNRQQSEYGLRSRREIPSDIESNLILEDYLEIAEVAIRQLPEKRQKVFNLRYKNGLDNQEIAACLNISETTVRVHLLKATRFLRNYFKSHPEIPLFVMYIFV